MKALSIHKLELQAFLLATRLKDDTLKALTISINHVYTWLNSNEAKLQWLNSNEELPVLSLTVSGKSSNRLLLMSGTMC